ncbi:uncharacterized protein LOC120342202 [Styela clava]
MKSWLISIGNIIVSRSALCESLFLTRGLQFSSTSVAKQHNRFDKNNDIIDFSWIRNGAEMSRNILIVVLATICLLLPAVKSGNTEGRVNVECDHRKITISVSQYNDAILNASDFYISLSGNLDTNYCFVSRELRKTTIYFPFQVCGMKPAISNEGVVYSSSIWIIERSGYFMKYADFSCRYGSNHAALSPPRNIATENLTARDGSQTLVSLCRTPYYCPRKLCPAEESFTDHAIYFANDVMHLEIAIQSDEETLPVAIEELHTSCGSRPQPDNIRYHSVHRGCQTQNIQYSNQVDQDRTLRTYVDYNGQSNTICLSVYTPPVKNCPVYFIRGSVTRCSGESTRCPDITGWRCDNGTKASEFSYGPFHLLPRDAATGEVNYIGEDLETTSISYEETTTNSDEYFDINEDFVPGGRSTADIQQEKDQRKNIHDISMSGPEGGEPSPKFDLRDRIRGRTSADIIDKSLQRPNSAANTRVNVINMPTSTLTDADHSGELEEGIDLPALPSAKRHRSKAERGKSRRNRKNRKKSQVVVKGVFVEVDGTDAKDIPQYVPETEKHDLQDVTKADEVDAMTVPSPARKVAGRGNIKPSLAKFTAADGNKGFIWASVTALALFLLLSIGILAAWTANKRKRSGK